MYTQPVLSFESSLLCVSTRKRTGIPHGLVTLQAFAGLTNAWRQPREAREPRLQLCGAGFVTEVCRWDSGERCQAEHSASLHKKGPGFSVVEPLQEVMALPAFDVIRNLMMAGFLARGETQRCGLSTKTKPFTLPIWGLALPY